MYEEGCVESQESHSLCFKSGHVFRLQDRYVKFHRFAPNFPPSVSYVQCAATLNALKNVSCM